MGDTNNKYEAVIGLEVHAQLLTNSKIYSSDINTYGATPNTNVSPISLGHPGTLPRVNEKVIAHAVKLGLALECDIRRDMHFARKNYFYPDLPKGYQITQDHTPICNGGVVEIKLGDGTRKSIGLTRIHMEEDSGKSIHDQDPFNTLVDLNRAGVPLLEIVSEPDLRTGEEAYQYLTEVRKLVRYLDICDGNMEEGSLRCDANISVRLKGAKEFGTKVEVKNMNSIRNVQRAIDHEIKRQIQQVENGEVIHQETRNFDATSGTTSSMRGKEMAHDYRYFPEPDLQPVKVTQDYIEQVRSQLPPLPNELFEKYTSTFGLSEYDAGVLTDSKEVALFYEEVVSETTNYKAAANWVMGDVKSYLNQNAVHIDDLPIRPNRIAEIIKLINDGKISNSIASQKVFPQLIKTPEKTAQQIAEENNWVQESDEGAIEDLIKGIVSEFPDEHQRYKDGNKGLVGFFMGEVMKRSKGKADPRTANQLVRKVLDES